eukprot:CAMPEP_0185689396 /NCGR_PEP_ID=MMETSP1164-20130828/424_1 /TAXON_ID=1104430 /ORGANISM="Chrysoreinhardia sp, Strain CCMP2950" /LENGTH=262 /DNA_ID=CAMNT_0028355885 /DNA_START=25 /DNA_END=814 /DNA_ORIENTATION=-
MRVFSRLLRRESGTKVQLFFLGGFVTNTTGASSDTAEGGPSSAVVVWGGAPHPGAAARLQARSLLLPPHRARQPRRPRETKTALCGDVVSDVPLGTSSASASERAAWLVCGVVGDFVRDVADVTARGSRPEQPGQRAPHLHKGDLPHDPDGADDVQPPDELADCVDELGCALDELGVVELVDESGVLDLVGELVDEIGVLVDEFGCALGELGVVELVDELVDGLVREGERLEAVADAVDAIADEAAAEPEAAGEQGVTYQVK